MKILKTITSLLCAFTLTLTSTPLVKTSAEDTNDEEENLIYETTEILKSRPLEYEYWESGAGVWTIEYTIKAYDTGHIHIDAKCLESNYIRRTAHAESDGKLRIAQLEFCSITTPLLNKGLLHRGYVINIDSSQFRHTGIYVTINTASPTIKDGVTGIFSTSNSWNGTDKSRDNSTDKYNTNLFSCDFYIREDLLYTNQTITLTELTKGVPDFDWNTYKGYGARKLNFYNAPYCIDYANNEDSDINYRVEWLNNNVSTIEHQITIPFENKLGDINNDNTITVADLVLLQKWLLAVPNTELPNWRAADLCKDNKLDIFDLCLLRRKLIEHSTQ